MKYIQHINNEICKSVAQAGKVVLFGQNISTGSCLSGLTRNLKVGKGGAVINTPNSENMLTGAGLGLMLGGVSSVFFMKQLDFLMLGIDHLVNTYNFIRLQRPRASFTIMPIVVDLGYQGMQSSANNLGDVCATGRVPGYTITSKADADRIISSKMFSPGFRIIGVSQRLFHEEIIDMPVAADSSQGSSLFQYSSGADLTIVCFNFSLPYGITLQRTFKSKGLNCSLFSVNNVLSTDWGHILKNVARTKKLLIIDDSKCAIPSCQSLVSSALTGIPGLKCSTASREFSNEWFQPNPEEFKIDANKIHQQLFSK